MIARIWHGKTQASNADEYLTFLQATGIPDYQKTQGNRGVTVLRRFLGDEAHFLLISFWESEEAIQRFAGADIEKAHYYPGDKGYLLEFEPSVAHYEVLLGP